MATWESPEGVGEYGFNIYIESSFFTTASGIEDVRSYFYAAPADSIGQRDISADYTALPITSGTLSVPNEVYITYSGALQDGFINASTRYETSSTISGMEVALVDYATPITSSGIIGAEDFDLEYSYLATKISTVLDYITKFTAGRPSDYSNNVTSRYWRQPIDSYEDDYDAYYTAGGSYDPLIPGPPEDQVIISGTEDTTGYFTTVSATNSGIVKQDMELSLAGYPMEFFPEKYTYKFQLVSGLESAEQGPEWEATVISGSVIDIPFDVLSTATATGYHNTDEICGLVRLSYHLFESETVSGTIGYYFSEAICGTSGISGYSFDVDLFSLKISNFSLDIDEYTAASGMICVDLTDDVHNVVVSGSYFIVDDTIVSGTSYIPITDGYTMCYDSPTDFDDLLGTTTITVHTANDNGDTLEQDFYLTSGYIVEYDNVTQDYGFNSQVVVRGTAENLASCPDTGADAYFFTTVPKYGVDLGATIVGQPWGEKDLGASITPTTDTIYFYGKTFRIEVRARDFAGNVMDPFTFEFRIEDEPE